MYGNVQEIIPNNCLKPLGKCVTTTTTIDANLLHCLATGASLTACLHFCNQTPTDWYSKKQATVEMAKYGSEFVAAKTVTEQIMDMRYAIRYLGVPIKPISYMFCDNRSVATSATLPHSTLSKRHNIIAFHRVREAISAKIIDFHWIQYEYNLPNDSKATHYRWPYHTNPMSCNKKSQSYPNNTPHTKDTKPLLTGPITQTHKYPINRAKHTTIHIPTFYYTYYHKKNMPHPPLEGSNRSLAYPTLLSVSW